MANVSAGPDGIAVPGVGWSNQSTQYNSNVTLESYGLLQSDIINPPAMNNYLGWSMITEDAIATTIAHPASNTNILTRIFVPQGGTTTKVDLFPLTNSANVSSCYVGLYSTAGVQLAVTAESHSLLVNNTQVTLNWAASYNTVGQSLYYIAFVTTYASTAPTFAGCLGASPASLNAGLTAATSEAATNGTAATLPGTYTMSSNTQVNYEYFFGIK